MIERLEESWFPILKNDNFIKKESSSPYSSLLSKNPEIYGVSNPNPSLYYMCIALSTVLHYGITCFIKTNSSRRRELRRYHDSSYTDFEEIKKNDTSANSSNDKDYNQTNKIVDQIVNTNFPDIENAPNSNITDQIFSHVIGEYSPNITNEKFTKIDDHTFSNNPGDNFPNFERENFTHTTKDKFGKLPKSKFPIQNRSKFSKIITPSQGNIDSETCPNVTTERLLNLMKKKSPIYGTRKSLNRITKNSPSDESKKKPPKAKSEQCPSLATKKSPNVAPNKSLSIEAKKTTKEIFKGIPTLRTNKSPTQTTEKPPAEVAKEIPNAAIEKKVTPDVQEAKGGAKSHFQNFMHNAVFSLRLKIRSQMNKIRAKLLAAKTRPSQGKKKKGDRKGDSKEDSEKPKIEEHSEEWKIQQLENWKKNLDKEYSAWKVSLANENNQWILQKNVVFENILNRIKEKWISWNIYTLEDINEGIIRLKDLENEEQWSKWLDANWKPYNKRTWIDLIDSYEKLYYHWIRTQWNKWKSSKMTEWISQEWKVHEEEKWEQWESRKWTKCFQRKEKNEWIKWITRNELEITAIRNWLKEKENMCLEGEGWINWDKWKQEKFQILDEYLDSLKNEWLSEKKWMILTNASKKGEQAAERTAPGGKKTAIKNAHQNNYKTDEQSDNQTDQQNLEC
ncbi:Tryptophan-rich antigen [Plasmodium coatneyi]|uniref:Tryptophan-rich antigen n=1 Tax=Plasmodium coatneyi TaxID=208452 RepID=A0A1B1DYG5_9APIC|nr:Tryptophan-rich antigen [Plasmodium coatneyi]ANQ07627.1 Tryptophan-rich antigen [Plasmodium coatneyi]